MNILEKDKIRNEDFGEKVRASPIKEKTKTHLRWLGASRGSIEKG